jgi:Tol biopolymer transport system component
MEIAFRSFRDGNYDVYVMDVDSRAARQMTQTDPPLWNGNPVWSPDGSQIAFESNRDEDWNIYVMDNNGNNLRNLTPDAANDQEPAWSPDGRFLAFTSDRDGNDEIYLLELETGSIRRLTYHCAGDYNAAWRGVGNAAASGAPSRTAVGYVISGAPNLRNGPNTNADITGGAQTNECLTITGRSQDTVWLRVETTAGLSAWITRDRMTIQGDLSAIPTVDE